MRLDLVFMIRDIYINSNFNPLTKFHSNSRGTEFKDIPPMEHLSNDHEDYPNQHKNNHKLCNEAVHLVLSLTEGQWKLRQQHDFPNGGKDILEQILATRNKSKRAGL